jgi:hypothetical protein
MQVNITPMGNGEEQFEIREGSHIWQIPLRAVASWGTLLGLTDPVEIIERIMTYDDPSRDGETNVWGPLYESLRGGLDELAKAGVPPEFMPTLVDPAFKSPIPGPEVTQKIAKTRAAALKDMNASRKQAPSPSEFRQSVAALLKDKKAVLEQHVVDFVDNESPTYVLQEAQADPVAESAESSLPLPVLIPSDNVMPGSVADIQIHLTAVDISNI